ncbi:MAG: DUF2752 domain-containing protein [Pirellulaceae bacterium]
MTQADQASSSAPLTPESPASASAQRFRGETTFHATLLIVSTVVVLLSVFLSTSGEQQVLLPLVNLPTPGLCVSKNLLGLDCPGCGMTRCFISVAHGDFAAAWRFNPAGILLFGVLVSQIPIRIVQLLRLRAGRPPFSLHKLQWVLWVVVVVMFAQWSVKLATQFFL